MRIIPAVLLITMAFLAKPLQAATVAVAWRGPDQAMRVGTTFSVALEMTTPDTAVNAVEGVLVVPDFLRVVAVSDGDSVINFWVDRPAIDHGTVRFSGIVPGGYFGQAGRIVTLRLQAEREGSGVLTLDGLRLLAHDGVGTALDISPTPLPVSASVTGHLGESVEDTVPPEAFVITITRDPLLYDGQSEAVFATQDKGTGVVRYEVSIDDGAFREANSPYPLSGEPGRIVVRAYDGAGNMREVRWQRDGFAAPGQRGIVIGSVVVALFLILFAAWRFRRR